MKPEELRIGNVIETQDLGPWHETIVTPQTMELMYLAPETYRGIPLTEEWLVRMGFKNDISPVLFYFDMDKKHYAYWNNVDKFGIAIKEKDENDFYIPLPHVQHVHQLQNVMFDLCGEELKLA